MTPATDPAIGSTHRMAPLIRFTLLGLYLALVLPLPVLAKGEGSQLVGCLASLGGFALVVALTSERVELDGHELKVSYPSWCSWLLRRGWKVQWSDVVSLTAVATSQGGRVYYVRCADGSARLLPQRVDHFEQFLANFSQASGLDTSKIKRISPPWTYQLLAILSWGMLAIELSVGIAQGIIVFPAIGHGA